MTATFVARNKSGSVIATGDAELEMVGGRGFLTSGQVKLKVVRAGRAMTAVVILPELDAELTLNSWPQAGERFTRKDTLTLMFGGGPVVTVENDRLGVPYR